MVPIFTEKQIMGRVGELVASVEGAGFGEFFKRGGKFLSGEQVLNFYTRGIREAKTLEELNDMSSTPIELRCFLSVWDKENSIVGACVAKSSEDLLAFIVKSRKYIESSKEKGEKKSIYVGIEFLVETIPLKAEYRRKTAKEPLTNYFVVYLKGHGYVKRLTARRINITENTNHAKQLRTRKEAERWVENVLKARYRGEVEIEEIGGTY